MGGCNEERTRRSDLAAHLEDDGSRGAPSPTTVASGRGGFALRHGKTDEVFRGRGKGGLKRWGSVFSQREDAVRLPALAKSRKQPLFYSGSQINIRRPKKWLRLQKRGLDAATVEVFSWPAVAGRKKGKRDVEVSFAGVVFCCASGPHDFPLLLPIFALGWLFLSLVPVSHFQNPTTPAL